jgi:hypothetical protein
MKEQFSGASTEDAAAHLNNFVGSTASAPKSRKKGV